MWPTPTGRIHTRTATIVLPAIFGLIVSLVTGHWDWLVLIGVYYLLGIFLDTDVYSWLLEDHAPWSGFVLALSEFGLLLVLAGILNDQAGGGLSHVSFGEAAIFFWCAWILAALTKIRMPPIASLTYVEAAGGFRRTEWSIPP